MAIDKKTILNKYMLVVAVVFAIAFCILFCAAKIVFVEGSMWKKYAETLKKEDIVVKPERGNIYSSDGQLMASSVPLYYVYMDMKANGMKLDTLRTQIDSLSRVLSGVLQERSAADYRRYILNNLSEARQIIDDISSIIMARLPCFLFAALKYPISSSRQFVKLRI